MNPPHDENVKLFLDFVAANPETRAIVDQIWAQLVADPIIALSTTLRYAMMAFQHNEGRGFFLGVLAGVVVSGASSHPLFKQGLQDSQVSKQFNDLLASAKKETQQ